MAKYLIVIVGPTASGKTALAIALAQYYKTEILSADSRQLFNELTIGTAKPSMDELREAKHHFINHLSITSEYSAGKYEAEAIQLLGQIYQHNDLAIIVGGTGMYINAVLNGLDALPAIEPDIRATLNTLHAEKGIEHLQQLLNKLDPVYYSQVDLRNPQRIIRALEVCMQAGKPFSSFRTGIAKQRIFAPIKIGLNPDKATLHQRINKRVDEMIANGLLDEVKSVVNYKHNNALQTVGYSELFNYLDGKTTFDEAINLIKQNTRRYAKRQITWFKRDKDIMWFDGSNTDAIMQHVNKLLLE